MTIPWLRLSTRVAHFLGVTLPEETDFHVGVEAWGRGDYDTALREFRLLAEQGHAQAQVNLGIMYSQGRGVHGELLITAVRSPMSRFCPSFPRMSFLTIRGHNSTWHFLTLLSLLVSRRAPVLRRRLHLPRCFSSGLPLDSPA